MPEDSRILEPFAGTAVVSRVLGRDKGCMVNDTNRDLNALYWMAMHQREWNQPVFQTFVDHVHALMSPTNWSHDTFYVFRAQFNAMPRATEADYCDPLRVALFFYLQNTAHFGLYRLNNNGDYTSTYHFFHKADYNVDGRLKALDDTVAKFRRLGCMDWKKFCTSCDLDSIDVVFLDPPYLGTTNCGAEVGFDFFAEIDEFATYAKRRGKLVVVCNYKDDSVPHLSYEVGDVFKGSTSHVIKNVRVQQKLSDTEVKLERGVLYAVYS